MGQYKTRESIGSTHRGQAAHVRERKHGGISIVFGLHSQMVDACSAVDHRQTAGG